MRALSRKGYPSKWTVFAQVKFCAHLVYVSTEGGEASVLQRPWFNLTTQIYLSKPTYVFPLVFNQGRRNNEEGTETFPVIQVSLEILERSSFSSWSQTEPVLSCFQLSL